MKKNSLSLDAFLPYQLAVSSERINSSLAKIYSQYDITQPEWRILFHLSNRKILQPSELVVLTSMHKARVSRALSLLEKKHLVTRQNCLNDKRSTPIELTQKGLDIYKKMEPHVSSWQQEIVKNFSEHRYDQLLILIKQLNEDTELPV